VVNLGWKLAGRLEGWGGEALLASYSEERQPVFACIGEDVIAGGIRREADWLRKHNLSDREDFEKAWTERAGQGGRDPVFAPHYEGSSIVIGPPEATVGIHATPVLYNRRDVMQACLGGSGGIMSARGAARFFAMLANRGELDGVRLLSADLLMSLTSPRDDPGQIDAVWAGGGRVPLDLTVGGYWRSDLVGGTGPHFLCHGGVGGSIGWADLDTGVAVSICHNRMFHAVELNDQHPYAMLRTEIARLAQAALAR
jgi:CubicO group peptidase (beta-lactamase class C family)